jgi:hypothetical protein
MIRSTAKEILEEAGDDQDAQERCLYEAADSGVIYTSDCLDIIRISPNEDAYFEDFCELKAFDFTEVVTKLAHAALLCDLREKLSELTAERVRS